MELSELRARYFAVLYTLSSALSGVCLVNKMPAEAIYSYASKHSLAALACHGLELAGAATPDMSNEKLRALRRELIFDTARAEICKRLNTEKIKYVLLKGVILKKLYPSAGLREMADNDILIDPSCRRKVKRIMRELGYKVASYGSGNHDVYTRDTVLNFEIHVSLFSNQRERLYSYFESTFDRVNPASDGAFEHLMSDEDFYIYMKAHEYKHYANGGTGLRSFVDTYLFLKAHEGALDMEYIERECSLIGILEYERASRALSLKIFDKNMLAALLSAARGGELPITEDEANMLDYVASSGTYGTVAHSVENAMEQYEKEGERAGKLKFLWRRLVPPMSFYKESAPFVYKYKIFIPFYIIWRLIKALFRNPARIFAQIKDTVKYKKEK